MTLGGLAAAVGLVIDDAIVVVENIVLHRSSGQTRSEAVRSAIGEIRIPLVGSTVTPIVVFLPLITITGVTGTFFRALAVTVGVALLTSLGLALTWTPALSQLLMSDKKRQHAPAKTRLTSVYDRTLRFVLARPAILPIAMVLVVVVSFFCYRALGSDLLPSMDEGGFVLDYLMPAGASLTDTNQVLNGVEQILHGIPEVQDTSRRTGLQLGLATVTEANTGDISVKLKADRHRGVDEIIADIRGKVNERYPQLDTDFTQVLQDMIGDLTSSPDPIEVKLYSENVALLKLWAPRVGDQLKTIPAVKDVKNGIEDTISGPAMTFRVDETAAARAGFTPQEIEIDTSALLQGEPAANPVIVNGRPWGVRVKLPTLNNSLSALTNTVLVSATGGSATLGTLSSLTVDPGQLEVRRENLQRDVAVTARLEGISLGTGIVRVQKAISQLHLPSAIRVEYGGLYAEQQQSFRELLVVLLTSIVLVFTVLLLEFRQFAAAAAIVLSAVLSTSGVFLALLITGTTFNVSSFMGLVMVVGIVAKNGILLLDAEQHFRASGMSGTDALLQAGERRLRPILMTATASTAGMLPLSFAIGSGSEMLKPLAIAVIGGVCASIVLSLVVTPVVHRWLTRD
jgi:multidrug efflux pump subunit AcrB